MNICENCLETRRFDNMSIMFYDVIKCYYNDDAARTFALLLDYNPSDIPLQNPIPCDGAPRSLKLGTARSLVVPDRHGLVTVRGSSLVDWHEVDVLGSSKGVGVVPNL